MSLRSKYAKQVRDLLGKEYCIAWPPDNTQYTLGTYGRVSNDVLDPSGNIRDLGIRYTVYQDTSPSVVEFISAKGVIVTHKAVGEVSANLPNIPPASAGLGIEFKDEGGFLIEADECYEDRIENPAALKEQLVELNKQKKWDTDFRVVTWVLRMPSAVILVSKTANNKFEISFDSSVTPSVAALGNGGILAKWHQESSSLIKYIPAHNVSPIVQLHRLKKSWWPWAELSCSAGYIDAMNASVSARASRTKPIESQEVWQLVLDDGTE